MEIRASVTAQAENCGRTVDCNAGGAAEGIGADAYESAAEVLGVPVGTVRSRLFRGRRLLQKSLYMYAVDAGLTTMQPPTPLEVPG